MAPDFYSDVRKKIVLLPWRHDTQHNDTQHNDTQLNDTQHNNKKRDTQRK